jgi:ABC-type transporter MlaC component
MTTCPKRSVIACALAACLLPVGLVGQASSQPGQESSRLIEAAYTKISRLLDRAQASSSGESHHPPPEVTAILRGLLDFETITREIMGNYRSKLSRSDRVILTRALEDGMVKKGMRLYHRLKTKGDVGLQLRSHRMGKNKGKLAYSLLGEKDKVDITLHLTNRDGEWVITDVESGDRRLTDYFGNIVSDILKKYSFPVLIAELDEAESIMIDDFSEVGGDGYPQNWIWKKDENDEILFTVEEEGGNRYLKAKDRGGSVTYGKEFRWDIKRYPYISWRWRVHALPPGGDERFNETNDSAAAVYILYDRNLFGVPKVLKYVWSTTLAEGTATRRKGIGRPWTVVAKSGEGGKGTWHTEVFDALEAFRKTFGEDPPDKALGIAILTDANATDSYAEADYDDFKLLQTAEAGSGVKQFMKGGK